MNTHKNGICISITQDNSKCRAAAKPGSDFCYFHDPKSADKRREAQSKGGRQNHTKALDSNAPDVKVADCGDAIALIAETINQVRKGIIDPKVANCVGFLANILLKALERDKLETRIEELEAAVKVQAPTFDLIEAEREP